MYSLIKYYFILLNNLSNTTEESDTSSLETEISLTVGKISALLGARVYEGKLTSQKASSLLTHYELQMVDVVEALMLNEINRTHRANSI